MFKYAAGSILFIAAAITLFSIPLILKHKVYVPVHKYVVRGDELLFEERYPNFWCEAQELSSNSRFNTFLYEQSPAVDESATENTHVTSHVKIPNKAQEFWGLHFLKGTNVSLWSCVKLSGASITLVRGKDRLRKCVSQYSANFDSEEDSLESESDSESDEATSSISSSQGVISNESSLPYPCSTAIEHRVLATDYRCNAVSRRLRRKFMFSYHVPITDYYYFVFVSDTYLDIIPNEFAVKLVLERTSYSRDHSTGNCTMVNSCDLPLSFGTDLKIVVQMPGSNGTLEEEEIVTKCQPRKAVFFVFYLGFAVVLFLCAFQ